MGWPLEKLKNYRPSEKEPFMNDRQREYFRAKLLAWKDEILRESRITLQTLQEENVNHPDLADRASSETDRAIELRARDRQRKLIAKIDEGHRLALATQLKVEDAAIESQRFLDIADFQRDVVEADGARLGDCDVNHFPLLLQPVHSVHKLARN